MKIKMQRLIMRLSHISALALSWINPCFSMDSYRFLHVTIDTPWSIFVFLLLTIFAPFVLMAVLVWRYAERKVEKSDNHAKQTESKE